MRNYHWPEEFHNVWSRAVEKYRGGNRKASTIFDANDVEFLSSIGCTNQELFDFVEDFARGGEPAFETVLLTAAVRREYFLTVQNGVRSDTVIDMDALPPKDAEAAGIKWLPRIIEKARAKLRGEMPDDLMYGCGGDRPFLESVNVEPSDFLRIVWQAGDDNQKIIDYVLRSRSESRA